MKFKLDKQKFTLLLFFLCGILLIVFSGTIGITPAKSSAQTDTDVSFYTSYLEKRITDLCQSIEGIDKATVFLTMDCSNEYVYSEDNASDFLILSGKDGEQAILLYELYPRVRGVAVVCTGGDLPRVRETVTDLLSAALDLPSNKIKVAGG